VTVSLETVYHHSEGLQTVLDPHLRTLVQFGVGSAQSDECFIGADGDGKDLVVSGGAFIEVCLSEEGPEVSEQVDCVIGELWVNVGLAVRDVSSEVGLREDVLGPRVRLVNVVLLIDLIMFCVLLRLIGVDDIIVILIEAVIALLHFGGQSVVAAHSLPDPLVLLCALLVQDDEDEVEAGEEGVGHADVLGRRHVGLIFSVDGIGGSDD